MGEAVSIARNPTRAVGIGSIAIGGGRPIAVQSMCATKTTDVEATLAQIESLAAAGAGVVRVAVDTPKDVEALAAIRPRTRANLSVDLQENYRLAERVAPWVDKIRYNPGHLHHHEPDRPWQDKVRWLADAAGQQDCAIRIGVNGGSVDPALQARFAHGDSVGPMLASVLEHCAVLDAIGFDRYCVSLKDSDPVRVLEANRRFAAQRPDVPLHLGVTEAGMPPEGIARTRAALGPLLREGIGDTLRVSLTVPFARKCEEVEAGRRLLDDVARGVPVGEAETESLGSGLRIVSCPSCSRVENEAFVELAEEIRRMTRDMAACPLTIAVMGCRVNGPGETDDADLGVWCGPTQVHLSRRGEHLGAFGYAEILGILRKELDRLVGE
ncbi:MAG: flavodoxin-dependent (E)-4-hydroxy-3-methylbut-2-enyl-diphosphate synthase [Pirellulales bacterium]|nr:flavodoxin-dependent (E)-4-hydroxy-3-methylbut-2-enyl-diphosphate synthase [Pirellulales bacterium]